MKFSYISFIVTSATFISPAVTIVSAASLADVSDAKGSNINLFGNVCLTSNDRNCYCYHQLFCQQDIGASTELPKEVVYDDLGLAVSEEGKSVYYGLVSEAEVEYDDLEVSGKEEEKESTYLVLRQ